MFRGERENKGEKKKTPANEVAKALHDAKKGQMPSFTQEQLLTSLHLEGDTPDGRALMERFTQDNTSIRTIFDIVSLMDQTTDLLISTNARRTNEAQEAVAHILGQVITKQVNREGDICPGARQMALSSTREDIIPQEVKDKLVTDQTPHDTNQHRRRWARRAKPDIFDTNNDNSNQ